MKLQKALNVLAGLAMVALGTGNTAHAATFGGVEFPDGAISFADAVISYNPSITNGSPISIARDPSQALGVPNCGFLSILCDVSLGRGGSLTLKFIDNFLSGSGNATPDLWIFETGVDVENTFVDISKDGFNWYSLGKVNGGTQGIDIDAFGWGRKDLFSYVRLTDDPNQGNETSFIGKVDPYLGADIDAVAALWYAEPINSDPKPKSVPEPASTLALLTLSSFAVIFQFSKQRQSRRL